MSELIEDKPTSELNSYNNSDLSSISPDSDDETSSFSDISEVSDSSNECKLLSSLSEKDDDDKKEDSNKVVLESVCKRNKVEESKPAPAAFGSKAVFGSAAKSIVSFNSIGTNADLPAKSLFAEEFREKSSVPETKEAITSDFEIITGEEEECTLTSVRGKLFEFNPESKDWHERGVGNFKLNKSNKNDKYRILMRTEGVQKLILNSSLIPKMICEVVQEKNIRFSANNFDSKIQTFILRMKTPEDAQNLEKAFADAIKEEVC